MDILQQIEQAIRAAMEEGMKDRDELVTFAVESTYDGENDLEELRYYAEELVIKYVWMK